MSIGAKGINNLGGLVAFRFCLGLVEAGQFWRDCLRHELMERSFQGSSRVSCSF